jgi:hypothetical protein
MHNVRQYLSSLPGGGKAGVLKAYSNQFAVGLFSFTINVCPNLEKIFSKIKFLSLFGVRKHYLDKRLWWQGPFPEKSYFKLLIVFEIALAFINKRSEKFSRLPLTSRVSTLLELGAIIVASSQALADKKINKFLLFKVRSKSGFVWWGICADSKVDKIEVWRLENGPREFQIYLSKRKKG